MKCPKCSSKFISEEYEGVTIDRCIRCKGTWLDEGELIHIINKEENVFDKNIIQTTLATAFSSVPNKEKNLLNRALNANLQC